MSSDSPKIDAHPAKSAVLFALSAGLAAAWWGAFHEVACGFVLVGTSIDPLYAYIGCYMHSIGCIFGALFAPLASRSLSGPSRQRGMLAILGIELVLTAIFFAHLAMRSPIAPTVLQIPVNALACIAAVLALETLSRFSFKEVGGILVGSLCCFAVVNYAAFPALIRLSFGIHAIMAVEILLLVAAFATAMQFYRFSSEEGPQTGTNRAAVDGDEEPAPRAFAWQPACFLAAYGALFGFMHVESSKLIVSFSDRSTWLLVGIACATVIVSLFILKVNKRESVWRYYRSIVFPLIMCAFLMLQEHTVDVAPVSVALVYASMSAFLLLTVLACIRISIETSIPLARVGRTAICLSYASVLVGMSVDHCVTRFYGFDALDSPLVAIVALVVLCAATFWVGDDKSVSKIWGRRIEKDPRSMRDAEFDRHIASLAESYNLTAKEQTILTLLAKGKRASQISEEQFISVNTVRTHIRNVYNKLNVHSFQELLKKLEEE